MPGFGRLTKSKPPGVSRQGETPERLEIIRRAKTGDPIALADLYKLYDRAIHLRAKRYSNERIEADDLFQEGRIVMLRVLNDFDVTAGVRFISFLITALNWQLYKVAQSAGVIRRPYNHPKYRRLAPCMRSLDELLSADLDGDLHRLIWRFDEDSHTRLERDEALTRLNRAMLWLPERTQLVMRARLSGRTFRSIAFEIDVSHERARGIWHEGIRRLRDITGYHPPNSLISDGSVSSTGNATNGG